MITVVSGYWDLKTSKYDKETYEKWMENSLSINAPYVFFCEDEHIDLIKKLRPYPTMFIKKSINDFYFKNKYNFTSDYTHEKHCPSVELGLIWLEKIRLVKEASEKDNYGNEWYAWLDSGICTFRDNKAPSEVWPNPKKIFKLKKNALNYTRAIESKGLDLNVLKNSEYIHIVTGTWIIHKSMINKLLNLFERYFNAVRDESLKNNKNYFLCLSDQVVWTRMFLEKPNFFNRMGDDYGKIVNVLY